MILPQSPYARTKAFVVFFLKLHQSATCFNLFVMQTWVCQVPSTPSQLAALLILNKRLRIGTLLLVNSVIELSTILKTSGSSINTDHCLFLSELLRILSK